MAVLTFDFEDGYKVGESTHFECGLRELSPEDIYDSQLAAEQLGVVDGRPYAYVSDVQMGMEMLCRQVAYIGAIQGPFKPKELFKLSPGDFALLQKKAKELDDVMVPMEVVEALSERGRPEVAD